MRGVGGFSIYVLDLLLVVLGVAGLRVQYLRFRALTRCVWGRWVQILIGLNVYVFHYQLAVLGVGGFLLIKRAPHRLQPQVSYNLNPALTFLVFKRYPSVSIPRCLLLALLLYLLLRLIRYLGALCTYIATCCLTCLFVCSTSQSADILLACLVSAAQWAEMNISRQNKISSSGIDRLGWGYA